MAYVYLLQSNALPCAYKIGQSETPGSLKWRLTHLNVANPLGVTMTGHIWVPSPQTAYALEQALHRFFAVRRLNGEWFLLHPEEVELILSLRDEGDFEMMREMVDVEPYDIEGLVQFDWRRGSHENL